MNYTKVIHDIFKQFASRSFKIKFWDGTEIQYGDNSKNLFTLIFNTERSAKRLLSGGSLGFGESYMSGDIQIEGNIEEYLKIRHSLKKIKISPRLIVARFLGKIFSFQNRQEQIAQHYDIGNSFFEMILDKETMSYSAGKFSNNLKKLDIAQKDKLKFICDKLHLNKGSQILDLGSGWGSFAKYAIEHCSSVVKGYSLSHAQLNYCQKTLLDFINKNSLSLEYRDMVKGFGEGGPYDAIVVLESMEHVGKDNLGNFFQNISKVIKPNHFIYIQTTARYISKPVDRWTLKYVFPGGYLPSKDELFKHAQEAGLIVEYFSDDTSDYIYTMEHWINNLEKNKNEIIKMFGNKFYRLWELWIHGAKVAFEANSINLFRLCLKKPN